MHTTGFRRLAAACLGFNIILAAAGARAQVPGAPPPNPDLADTVRAFNQDWSSASRFYDLGGSDERRDRLRTMAQDWQARLAARDWDALGQDGRIDFLLLRAHLDGQLSQLDLDRARGEAIEQLLSFRRAVLGLEEARRRMDDIDPEHAATELAGIPAAIKKIRERLEKGRKEAGGAAASEPDGPLPVTPVIARRAADAVESLRGAMDTWFRFYDGYTPSFAWWVRKPHEEAAGAMEEYTKYLREELAGQKGKDEDPLVGDPIGREALLSQIRQEFLPYTPEELIGIGERELAWCEERMKEASAEMGFGDEWKRALDKVKSEHAPPGGQDEVVRREAREAIAFLKERDLVTIPPLCEETWRLRMLSPDEQRTLPFAAYGGQVMLVAYPTEAMKQDDKLMSMRGNNTHFTRIVTPHELIPGHHLQGFMSAREHEYRRMFGTPFFVEGWAVYWEMTLWELNYARTPEDKIGMLFWRMHRAARIIVSLKFHLGQMTPQEMVDFLVDRVGHERHGATGEVRRFIGGGYGPLYQCGYMIGALQLRALRKELVDTGKMTDRQFHDTILTYGPIPVELVRVGMLGLPLTRDYEPRWRFDGP
jgi:uncharacterized protein (DUF885 family)